MMDDLVSRKWLLEEYDRRHKGPRGGAYQMILDAPSADRPTGKWIVMETTYGDTEAKCNRCGFETLVNEPGNGLHMLDDLKFCPSCGAKMEVEHEHDSQK